MGTHRLVTRSFPSHAITRFPIILFALVVLLSLTSRTLGQDTCTGTFGGSWTSPQMPNGKLTISPPGNQVNFTSGEYIVGKSRRILKGNINGTSFAGNWVDDQQGGPTGTFTFTLFPAERRIEAVFFDTQQQMEKSEWFCQLGPQNPDPGSIPRVLVPQIFGPRTQNIAESDYDTDNFATFDSLPKEAQKKLLTKRGPRAPLEYDASDLSLRVFVRGGWPVIIDYGLEPEAFAELTIEVEGKQPLFMTIDPANRARVEITIPHHFGDEIQVAKVRILALTINKQPTDFRLYGIGMGEKGVAALRRVVGVSDEAQLAMNSSGPGWESGHERSPLFTPESLQTGSTIQLRVTPPTTIYPNQRPKKVIAFSYTSQSDFSNGRWEIRLVRGTKWLKVWEEKTGAILPRQTKSNTWDGIISIRRIVSTGNHALKITAWHGRESSRDWVIAQTDPDLIVKQ